MSGEITITNTTPEGAANLRLKDSDGKKSYANLTGRIAVGESASATVVAGQDSRGLSSDTVEGKARAIMATCRWL